MLLSIALAASRAHAQSVEPPKLTSKVEVAYPKSAHGDAVVVLELTVARDGAVTRTDVVAGGEPFLDEALGIAKHLVFEPARKVVH